MELATLMQAHNKGNKLTAFFLITWSLWGRRNKWLFEKNKVEPRRAIKQGLSLQTFFNDYNAPLTKELHHVGCWRPPNQGTFKLNTDNVTFFDQ